jgi:hypothetical protein
MRGREKERGTTVYRYRLIYSRLFSYCHKSRAGGGVRHSGLAINRLQPVCITAYQTLRDSLYGVPVSNSKASTTKIRECFIPDPDPTNSSFQHCECRNVKIRVWNTWKKEKNLVLQYFTVLRNADPGC